MMNLIQIATVFIDKGYEVKMTPLPKCGAGEQYLTATLREKGTGYKLSQFTCKDNIEDLVLAPNVIGVINGNRTTTPKDTLLVIKHMKAIAEELDLKWREIFYR